jgi:glycerol-3-phosphate acyltransferase PlsY
LLLVAGYLAGSVPTGLLLARRIGIDPRRTGSGNIGATNVLRAAGPRLGLLTLLGDVLKGALPTWIASDLAPEQAALTGLAAFLGHLFPPWLGFKGGKGVATALGVLLVLAPPTAGIGVATFATVVGLTGLVSLASIAACCGAAVAAWAAADGSFPAVGTMAALVVTRHASNLRRLLAGNEPRIGRSLFGQRSKSGQHPPD